VALADRLRSVAAPIIRDLARRAGLSAPVTVPVAPGRIRADSLWSNEYTGIGVAGYDKLQYHVIGAVSALTDDQLDALYHGSAIAARIIDRLPQDAMRQGYELSGPGADKVRAELDRLAAWNAVRIAWTWGRLYGLGAVLIGCDGGAVWEPIRLEDVRRIWYLTTLDATELYPQTYYREPLTPSYGEPQTWRIQQTTMGGVASAPSIHDSRLIRFGGQTTSRRRKMELQGRDYSVIQRCIDQLRAFDAASQAIGLMLSDCSIGVLKMDRYLDTLAQRGEAEILARLRLMNLSRSVQRTIPLDADKEDFVYQERGFNMVPDLWSRFGSVLAAAAGMPETILWGRSPAGMNATGASDQAQWYDTVRAGQDEILMPAWKRLVDLAAAAVGVDSAEIKIRLPALVQETAAEHAERVDRVSQTDERNIRSGLVTPDEVALARFGRGEWSDEAPAYDASRTGREPLALTLQQEQALVNAGTTRGGVNRATGQP
jgi:phage-related protein (TIGR01555 family)